MHSRASRSEHPHLLTDLTGHPHLTGHHPQPVTLTPAHGLADFLPTNSPTCRRVTHLLARLLALLTGVLTFLPNEQDASVKSLAERLGDVTIATPALPPLPHVRLHAPTMNNPTAHKMAAMMAAANAPPPAPEDPNRPRGLSIVMAPPDIPGVRTRLTRGESISALLPPPPPLPSLTLPSRDIVGPPPLQASGSSSSSTLGGAGSPFGMGAVVHAPPSIPGLSGPPPLPSAPSLAFSAPPPPPVLAGGAPPPLPNAASSFVAPPPPRLGARAGSVLPPPPHLASGAASRTAAPPPPMLASARRNTGGPPPAPTLMTQRSATGWSDDEDVPDNEKAAELQERSFSRQYTATTEFI